MSAVVVDAAPVLREVAAAADDVDAGRRGAASHVKALAAAGVVDLGIDDVLAGRPGGVTAQAEAIASLAEECLATAFGLWAHRMVGEYVARGHRTPASDALLDALRRGDRVGSTALAAGLKWLAGLGDLGVTATPVDGGWRLDGFVAWASNLVPGAAIVLSARTPTGTLVGWVDADAAGLTVRHLTGLLALDGTASGTLRLDGVVLPDDHVLADDLATFARGVKPVFLVLQSSFCVGLIRRSLAEAETALDRGENAVFAVEAAGLRREADDLVRRWRRAAADPAGTGVREVLQLRLDASHLAGRATRLEATLAGGRGYVTTSGASRRFREAAFLPVQSPSEGHLRWELSSLA